MTGPTHLRLTGTLTPDQTLTYVHLPFEVPEGIGQIDVAYSYDAAISSDPTLAGGNTIDIGIFDPRGIEFLNAGFRGWSGSARTAFSVGTETATPGYMPGPIFPGTWHICLGAYKVAPDGCHYQVDIDLHSAALGALVEFPKRLALDDRKAAATKPDGWYVGEMHCHTVNSDGDSTTSEVVALAESLGLDFLAIMDHNNLTHQVDLNKGVSPLVLIPGYEVTTYYGHWNIWGDGPWVDFRIQQPRDLQHAIAYARAQGYLVSCNHPRPFGPDWAFPEIEGYNCVEIWNGPWELLNTACMDFWETRLKRGEQLVAVGGSDFHFSHQPHIAQLAHPTNVVYVQPDRAPTATAILDAMRAGHCFVTESPLGPRITIRAGDAMMGDTVARQPDDPFAVAIDVKRGLGSEMQFVSAEGVLYAVDVHSDDVRFELDGP
ncbi:MAG TPA: CehA/McbA family metallohydrolase, partial [Candidatus Limnocylindrales bacterium]|nr:CehA/McbA family metallohydrolase [Candidatus Limnocylindrales bacterium]